MQPRCRYFPMTNCNTPLAPPTAQFSLYHVCFSVLILTYHALSPGLPTEHEPTCLYLSLLGVSPSLGLTLTAVQHMTARTPRNRSGFRLSGLVMSATTTSRLAPGAASSLPCTHMPHQTDTRYTAPLLATNAYATFQLQPVVQPL